jgi:hypothetical protein
LLPFETAPFFCVYPVFMLHLKLVNDAMKGK